VTLVLDSSWRVLPCLNIGVSWSCRGLDRRGGHVARGGKELAVISSIKSGAWHPKGGAHRISQILSGRLISKDTLKW